MPPCESVLLNKMKRTLNVTRMIKSSSKNTVDLPKAEEGYCLNEKNEYTIEYFTGYPYPDNFTGTNLNNNSNASSSDEDNCDVSSSDEEYNEDFEDDDWNLNERFLNL